MSHAGKILDKCFVAVFLGCTSTGRVGLWFSCSGSGFKCLRRRGNGLKSHPTDWEKPGIEPATPGLQDIGLFFCGFSMGRNQYWARRVYYMTGTPESSTESGFMEKPGIEPATPGLQGIALIHYTTGASFII